MRTCGSYVEGRKTGSVGVEGLVVELYKLFCAISLTLWSGIREGLISGRSLTCDALEIYMYICILVKIGHGLSPPLTGHDDVLCERDALSAKFRDSRFEMSERVRSSKVVGQSDRKGASSRLLGTQAGARAGEAQSVWLQVQVRLVGGAVTMRQATSAHHQNSAWPVAVAGRKQ